MLVDRCENYYYHYYYHYYSKTTAFLSAWVITWDLITTLPASHFRSRAWRLNKHI